jgi:prepilin-type N-terminal cleavage/methylation domain-containing protein
VKIRKNKGFTLMEVLIVVAIIAVLVAIAIPIYNGLVEKARVAADAATMRNAQTAFVVQELTTGIKPQERAIYDKASNTFITRKEYEDAKGYKTYKFYGQAYNENGGKAENGKGKPSQGTNAHIYVAHELIDESGEDYGPEVLVWWAAVKNSHSDERWGD